jgi:hypothetical protein
MSQRYEDNVIHLANFKNNTLIINFTDRALIQYLINEKVAHTIEGKVDSGSATLGENKILILNPTDKQILAIRFFMSRYSISVPFTISC